MTRCNMQEREPRLEVLTRVFQDLGARPYMVDKVDISRVIGSLGRVNVTGLIILFQERHTGLIEISRTRREIY